MARVPANRIAGGQEDALTQIVLHLPLHQGPACPVCGESSAMEIGRLKTNVLLGLQRGEYDLAQCQACELVYLSPPPSEADLRTMYVDSPQFNNATYTDPARVDAIMEYIKGCL